MNENMGLVVGKSSIRDEIFKINNRSYIIREKGK
jgi:hypothetical protein